MNVNACCTNLAEESSRKWSEQKIHDLVKSGLYFWQIACYEKAVFVVCWTKAVKRSTSVTKGSGNVPQDCNLD
jgi:hypothetical protein